MSQAQDRMRKRKEKMQLLGKDRLRGIESVKSRSIEDVQVSFASEQVDPRLEEIQSKEPEAPLADLSKETGVVDLKVPTDPLVVPVQSKTRILSLRTLSVCLLGCYLLFCYPDAHEWILAPVQDAHPLPLGHGVSVWILFTSIQCVFGVQDWLSTRESGYEWMDEHLPRTFVNAWTVMKRLLKVMDGIYGDIYTLVFVLGFGISLGQLIFS